MFAFISVPGIHHNSNNYVDGHEARGDKDWGLLQVDTISDRQ
jgi:hypothetical protein